jgi:hypothetical protein
MVRYLDSSFPSGTLSIPKTDVEVKMSLSIEQAAESDRKTVQSLAWTMVGFALLTVSLIVAALVIV